jgi:hypothetical protein
MFVDRRDRFPETLCPIIAEPHVAYRLERNSPGWHDYFVGASHRTNAGVRHGSSCSLSEVFLSSELLTDLPLSGLLANDTAFATEHMFDY